MSLPDSSVLPRDEVVALDLIIAPADHEARLRDLTERLGERGCERWALAESREQDPLAVPSTVRIAGEERTDATVRFAGHASLVGPWSDGKLKLPMHIDLPTPIDGFAQLHAVPGYRDDTLLREKLALEVMQSAGVPAMRGALCRLTLHLGDESVYCGLYTLLESPTDRFLVDRFGTAGGSLYEAMGKGTEWRTAVPTGFVHRGGAGDSDFPELRAAMKALHGRRGNRPPWREQLERRLDVDGFLRWLAANTVLNNRDTYGHKSHNYWLYADPEHEGRLSFIPLDLASAFTYRGPEMTLFHEDAGARYPLIGLLLDDAVYRSVYRAHLDDVLAGPFAMQTLHDRIDALHAIASPHVVGARGEKAPYTLLSSPARFDVEVDKLKGWIVRRRNQVRWALSALDGIS